MAPIALEITIHRFYSPAAVALTCRALFEGQRPLCGEYYSAA